MQRPWRSVQSEFSWSYVSPCEPETSSATDARKAHQLPLDPGKTRRDAALEQRPVEAERECEVAALDHLVRLLGRSRDAADRHAAPENAFLGARHQRDHFG